MIFHLASQQLSLFALQPSVVLIYLPEYPVLMYLSLITAIPPKAEEAFRLFRYVPYTSLSTLARVKASRGEDEVILNLSGGISVKLLDQRNEKSISVVEWHAAACVAKERTCFHHGEAQADALALHH